MAPTCMLSRARVPLAFLIVLAAGLVARAAAPAAPAGRAATADEATLLVEALEKTAGDLHRWAYTESRLIRDEKGKVKKEEVVRYDPSKPYAEQWTPISIGGKPPAAKDLEKYRKQGERAARAEERKERGELGPAGRSDRRITLGEVIDPRESRIVSETGGRLVFDIPLRKEGNDRFPPEKFEVLARIDRTTRTLEHVAVRLKEAFRVKLVAKVKSGDGTLEFAQIDPKHPPTLTSVRGDASVSILFVSVGGEVEVKRTELKHVKPYAERFSVQIGTIKALDL